MNGPSTCSRRWSRNCRWRATSASRRACALAAESIPLAAQDCGLALIQQLDLPVEVAARLRTALRRPRQWRDGWLAATHPAPRLRATRAAADEWPCAVAGRRGRRPADLERAHRRAGPRGIERRDLLLRVYYVARAADGDAATPALRMKSLTSVAGQPAFVDTEVMPGVEALQAQLLPDAMAPRARASHAHIAPGPGRSCGKARCDGSPSRANSRCAMRPRAEGFALLAVLALLAVVGLYTAATLQDALFGTRAGRHARGAAARLPARRARHPGVRWSEIAGAAPPADSTRELHATARPESSVTVVLRSTRRP